jgi:hypothetical protein
MWHFFPAFFLYQPTLTDKHSSASPRPQRNHNSSLCLLFTNLSVCPEIFSWIAWPLRDKWALVWLSCTKIGQNRSVKMRTREWLVLNYPCTLLFSQRTLLYLLLLLLFLLLCYIPFFEFIDGWMLALPRRCGSSFFFFRKFRIRIYVSGIFNLL